MIETPLTLPCGHTVPNRLCKSAMTEGLADAHDHATMPPWHTSACMPRGCSHPDDRQHHGRYRCTLRIATCCLNFCRLAPTCGKISGAATFRSAQTSHSQNYPAQKPRAHLGDRNQHGHHLCGGSGHSRHRAADRRCGADVFHTGLQGSGCRPHAKAVNDSGADPGGGPHCKLDHPAG